MCNPIPCMQKQAEAACQWLFRKVYKKLKNTFNLSSNLAALQERAKSLIDRRNNIRQRVEEARVAAQQRPTVEVEEWLGEIDRIEPELDGILRNLAHYKDDCCGCHFNCCLWYRQGQDVAAKLEQVNQLLTDGRFPANLCTLDYNVPSVEPIPGPPVEPLPRPSVGPIPGPSSVEPVPRPSVEPFPRTSVGPIPGPSVESETTASRNLAEVMQLLRNDGIRRIGVYGIGGVGKSYLVKRLNNELESNSSTQTFGTVIFAVVSHDWDYGRVRAQIAERLKMDKNANANLLFQRLRREKFLLILDDVWTAINLDELGIPQPGAHNGCKILLTTRFLPVCGDMQTDEDVKVETLNEEESWQLFCQRAGEVASSESIKPLAKAITKECGGLPLAIITVAAAMSKMKRQEQWKFTLEQLQKSMPTIRGIEEAVFKSLKLSYSFLQDNRTQSCFLYCSLYPEDFSIEESELIQCWQAEGLIDQQLNYEESQILGINVIENLKHACLLEDGIRQSTVKMHDIVRDVAIWIASSSESGCKSLVWSSGISSTPLSAVEFSSSLRRVSIMNSSIEELPHPIECSTASTLLLQGNRSLNTIPEMFLGGFPVLRVLKISHAAISSLPPLHGLTALRCLVLRYCKEIETLPSLDQLTSLQVLDLSYTSIQELPEGMEKLTKLRELHLKGTLGLKTIQAGLPSKWSSLEVLDMYSTLYMWHVTGEEREGEATFGELTSLEHLCVLSINLKGTPSLTSEDLSWIKKLKEFFLCIQPQIRLPESSMNDDKRTLHLWRLDLSEAWVGRLLDVNPSGLVIEACSGVSQTLQTMAVSCEEWQLDGVAQCDLLPNLETLTLFGLDDAESIAGFVSKLGLTFARLKSIHVRDCRQLKHLIPLNLNLNLANLEEIVVGGCSALEELFSSGSEQVPNSVAPKLRTIKLFNLPNLTTLCRQEISWQNVDRFLVFECNRLNIPRDMQYIGG